MPTYAQGTRYALGPSGYWLPVQEGGRPVEDFVLVANANGQGEVFMPRDELPADWQPGMSISNSGGFYRAVPYNPNGAVGDYYFHDYANGPLPAGLLGPGEQPEAPYQPPPQTPPSAAPGGTGNTGGLPLGGPPTTSGGLPPSTPVPGTQPPGGGMASPFPNLGGPVGMPPIGASSPRSEIERLTQEGLLGGLTLNNPGGVRAPDYGNGPGVPMQHDPGQAALFEYIRNNYFGTWDPRQSRGGSNPYYNAPGSAPGSLLPPMQGPVITGPGLLNP
jgi:hypothetical protein